MNGGNTFEFPKLKIADILVYMRQLDCPLTQEDISDPKPEVMLHVYEYFVELFMGTTREEIQQPKFGALDVFEYRELHEESIGEFGMHRMILKLMNTIGVYDYSMRDLIKPEKARVCRILSGLINFAKFRQEHLDHFQNLCETSETLIEQKTQLEYQNKQLSDELQRIRDIRLHEQPVVQELQDETNVLADNINARNNEQAMLRKEIEELKSVAAETKEKVTNTKLMLLNTKQDIGKLQSQIVQSPQKMKSSIAHLESQVESEKENLSEAHRRTRTLQQKIDTIMRIEKDLEKCTRALEDGCVEKAKLEALQKTIREAESKIMDNDQTLKEFVVQEHHLQRLIQSKEDQLSQQRSKRASKLQVAQESLLTLQEERAKASRERSADQIKLEEIRGKIATVQQKIGLEKQEHQQELDAVLSRCEDLEAQVSQYSSSLLSAMKQQPVA